MEELEIYDRWGEKIYIGQIIEHAALYIHADLAAKFVAICKNNPTLTPQEMPEFDEIKKIWDVMDFIQETYMAK